MFYERLFYTISLSLVNFLTIEKHHRIVKVKRDLKTDSMLIFFYFEATDELLSDVDEYKSLPHFENEYLNRGAVRTEGIWRGE